VCFVFIVYYYYAALWVSKAALRIVLCLYVCLPVSACLVPAINARMNAPALTGRLPTCQFRITPTKLHKVKILPEVTHLILLMTIYLLKYDPDTIRLVNLHINMEEKL